jgi:hypothetical protein
MNRKLVWLLRAAAALAVIWVLLYYVGYYLGEVGD